MVSIAASCVSVSASCSTAFGCRHHPAAGLGAGVAGCWATACVAASATASTTPAHIVRAVANVPWLVRLCRSRAISYHSIRHERPQTPGRCPARHRERAAGARHRRGAAARRSPRTGHPSPPARRQRAADHARHHQGGPPRLLRRRRPTPRRRSTLSPAAASCSPVPSRSARSRCRRTRSLLTGQYPFRHGVRNNGMFALPDAAAPLAAVLAERGYRTAAFVSASVLARRYGLAPRIRGVRRRPQQGLAGAALDGAVAPRRGDRRRGRRLARGAAAGGAASSAGCTCTTRTRRTTRRSRTGRASRPTRTAARSPTPTPWSAACWPRSTASASRGSTAVAVSATTARRSASTASRRTGCCCTRRRCTCRGCSPPRGCRRAPP